jgi:PAS domain S-box-containing protein
MKPDGTAGMTSERMDFESPRPNDRGAVPDGGRTVKPVTVTSTSDTPELSALHRNTFEQLPIGIAYASGDGRFIWTNQAFCSLLQLTARELAGQSIELVTHAEDFGPNDREFKRLWAGEIASYTQEKRYVRKDRVAIWVRVTATLVRNPVGEPICVAGFLEDIHAQKEAERAAVLSRRLIEAVIANVPAALIACDMHGNITLYNRAAAQLFSVGTGTSGAAPADMYPLAAQIYQADGVTPVPRADRPLARALRGETLTNVEQVVVPNESAPRTMLVSAQLLQGADAEDLGAVAVSQDISELRQREAEIERIHKQLMDASRQAGMAEVATNVLHNVGNVLNSVNISASVVADLVKRSKSVGLVQVAALLQERSHDLAAFITNDERGRQLPMYLATLAEHFLSEQRAVLEELDSLRANIDHIKETVAMQQTYAKRCGLIETVDVHALVEDSLRMNTGALTRHKVTLRREFTDVPCITVDKHRVLQILVNLVRNAKYACDESGRPDKEVCVRVENTGTTVRISVIDNGVGIKPEHRNQLFSHGFTTRQSGHGFGLHSAALAAAEFGGTLSAHSDGDGCGATFVLDLPLSAVDSAR